MQMEFNQLLDSQTQSPGADSAAFVNPNMRTQRMPLFSFAQKVHTHETVSVLVTLTLHACKVGLALRQ